MTRFKKISLLVAGIGLLAMASFELLGTRQVHAFVATMVQVANTAANPVPVTQAPTATTQIASVNTTLTINGAFVEQGPYDVSAYSNIRFYGDPPATGIDAAVNVTFFLIAVDANGNPFVLDTLTKSGDFLSVTGAYATPGTLLKVRMRAICSGPCPATIPANFTIYGR